MIEESDRTNIIIGGNFNIRIGNLGGIGGEEEGEERRSKDTKIGNEGNKLID